MSVFNCLWCGHPITELRLFSSVEMICINEKCKESPNYVKDKPKTGWEQLKEGVGKINSGYAVGYDDAVRSPSNNQCPHASTHTIGSVTYCLSCRANVIPTPDLSQPIVYGGLSNSSNGQVNAPLHKNPPFSKTCLHQVTYTGVGPDRMSVYCHLCGIKMSTDPNPPSPSEELLGTD